MPEVSIVIPFFKKKKYIIKTIKSVLSQSYKNFEVLIIYDDEENSDFFFLKHVKNLDKRIFLFKNKKNIGAGLSRNKGIKLARGKFIAFLDADDTWHRDKLKKQIYFMKKNFIKISCTSFIVIDLHGNHLKNRLVKKIYTYNDLLTDCPIGLSTVMIKKKIINRNIKFPSLKTKEDYVLWLKISKIFPIYGINSKLTYWRDINNSLSKNPIQKILDGFRVYKIYMNLSVTKSFYHLILLSINYVLKNK
jgi:teichuronic acid biosynthesis glycosyltransferase TuaG